MNDNATIKEGEVVDDFPIVPSEATSLPTLVEAFRPGGLDKVILAIEERVRSTHADVGTKKGRDEIKSLAYQVARARTTIDKAGLSLTEGARKQIDEVNAERKRVATRLGALQGEAREPLDKWEAAERLRVEKHQVRIQGLAPNPAWNSWTSADLRDQLAEIELAEFGEDWEEFREPAIIARDAAVVRVKEAIQVAEEREAREAEMARLRLEAEARDRKEREERDKREAEQAAELRKMQAERAAQEAELAALRREKLDREAAERAAAERQRLADLQAQEDSRREREMAERLERERKAAAEAERQRIDAERAREEAERKAREADAERREVVRTDIIRVLEDLARTGSVPDLADAMMNGRVPHVKVII